MKDSDEIATLVVAGHRFDNFQSVWLHHRWNDGTPMFRFTTADVAEAPPDWRLLQFKPGDQCAIYLGGKLAINGFILTRQTTYDANNHVVQLEGVGHTWPAMRASILDKTGNYDGMNFAQIANKVLAPTGVGILSVGAVNPEPYVKMSNEPGEKIWDFLERIARFRGIVLGSDTHGNFLLIGDHAYRPTASLIEGHNILRCNAIISIKDWRHIFVVRGSSGGTDGHSGTTASEQDGTAPGSLKFYSPLLTPAEHPAWNAAELAERAGWERLWNEGQLILVTVVVQGWLRADGTLWTAGDKVNVYSPMAMIQQDLDIQTVIFSQDSASGTTTTLELVAPWLLKDQISYDLTGAAAGFRDAARTATGLAPAEAPSSANTPAITPPAAPVPEPPPDNLPPR